MDNLKGTGPDGSWDCDGVVGLSNSSVMCPANEDVGEETTVGPKDKASICKGADMREIELGTSGTSGDDKSIPLDASGMSAGTPSGMMHREEEEREGGI